MIDSMQKHIAQAVDCRQTKEWARYMERIGWQVEEVDGIYCFIRPMPIIKKSFIKIQHPQGTVPFKKIDVLAKKYNALQVLVEPHTDGYSEKLYKKHGYLIAKVHYAPSMTIKIDLKQTAEQLLKSFSENARRNIKKAQKNNLIVKQIFAKDDKNNEYFEQYFSLLMSLRKMKGFYAPGHEESVKKMEALRKNSVYVFAYEKGNDEPIAVIWLAYAKGVITYIQTGITKRGYDLLANYLLVWEGLKLAQQLKMNVFDFESVYDPRYKDSSKGWVGYSEFKKRFHGETIVYPPSWIKFYNKPFEFFYRFATAFS